jgi:polysaccharide chain length determinant protein (PEP-CTERM system associated)
MHDLANQLLSILRAMWRYRWYALATAWLIALAGWVVVHQMPDRYVAYTKVYVDTESVLKPLMSGVAVNPDLDEVVAMVSQTMLSGPNLDRLIRMADLDIGVMSAQDRIRLVNRLRRDLHIESSKSVSAKRGAATNLYAISFVDQNPRVAQRVVESLLELFVERSLSDHREDSASARRFIDQQLEVYRERLQASERAVTAFKRRNLGLLPGEGPNYFKRLFDAEAAMRQAELELKEAEDSAASIGKQLEVAARNASLPQDDSVVERVEPETELEARIRVLELKLDDLRLRYTDQHPDIVAIVPMIAQLKKQREAEEKAKLLRAQRQVEAGLREELPSPVQARDPIYQELTVALTTAEADVAAMRARVTEHRTRYAELQAVASSVPQVEAEYRQLTRDYDTNKARYEDLLKRGETALISQHMESSDETMGFRVIDPPRLPLVPSEPDRLMLMTLVLLGAMGGGLGIAWLISELRPTINDMRRLSEVSGLPVLGTVVMAWTDKQKKRRKWGLVAFLTSFASLLSAYVAIMAMLVLTVSRV